MGHRSRQHVILGRRERHAASPTLLNTIDPTRDSAGVVAERGQPHSAFLHDRAAVAVIRVSIGLVIAGRQIERAEARLHPACLVRILDPDGRGQAGKNLPHALAKAIADHFDETVPVPGPVTLQFGDDGIEPRMKSRFSLRPETIKGMD